MLVPWIFGNLSCKIKNFRPLSILIKILICLNIFIELNWCTGPFLKLDRPENKTINVSLLCLFPFTWLDNLLYSIQNDIKKIYWTNWIPRQPCSVYCSAYVTEWRSDSRFVWSAAAMRRMRPACWTRVERNVKWVEVWAHLATVWHGLYWAWL